MEALVFDGALRYTEKAAGPKPASGEALIRVRMAGICETDIQIIKGYLGFRGIPGHEFVGVVDGVNGPGEEWVGKRVVGEINCGCGACVLCRKGLAKHCTARTTLGIGGRNGAFAEYLTLPLSNLHEVPDNVSDEEAVFVEPLAAAFEITEQLPIGPPDSVLVMGDGRLGILCALVLQSAGADVTLLGKHANKLRLAETLGVRALPIHASRLTIHDLYDIIVDATGSASGLEQALRFVRPCGTIVLKTTVAQEATLDLAPIVINEVTVIGSRCGPFRPALAALSSSAVRVAPLLTGLFPLSQGLEAMEAAQESRSLKVALDMRTP